MPNPTALLNLPKLAAVATIKQPVLAMPTLTHLAPLKPINPVISTAITADQLTVPIARRTPTDTDTFVSPDRAQHFFMPGYRIGETSGPNGARYDMAFRKDDGDRWGLRMMLEQGPPPGNNNRLSPLDHELTVTLSFHPGGDQGRNRKHISFDELQTVSGGVQATLWFASLPERDEVYHALTSPPYRTQVTLRRPTRLALPNQRATTESFEVATLENQNLFLKKADLSKVLTGRKVLDRMKILPVETLPMPELELVATDTVLQRSRKMARFRLAVANWKSFSPKLFTATKTVAATESMRPLPRLSIQLVDPKSGKPLRNFSGLSKPQDLQNLDLTLDPRKGLPAQVMMMIEDRKTRQGHKSKPVSLTAPKRPEPTYTVHRFDFEMTLAPDPFLFDPNLHPHIFAELAGPPPATSAGGLIRHREAYRDIVHSYFQDDVAQHTVYYLPDAFRLTRHTGPFRPPMVTVRVQSNGDDTANSEVTFDYVVAPYVDPERLAHAAQRIASSTGQDVADLTFQPYLTDALTFNLTRPSTTGRIVETRPTSPLMLQEPVVDTLVLNVTDFQIAFDAMLGQTASVVSGEIGITVEGWGVETRRFIADFAQLSGATMDLSVDQTGDHTASLTCTQAIESPLDFNGTRIAVSRGGMTVEATGPESVVKDVAPGETFTIPISYPDLPGGGMVQAMLLTSGPVRPDGEAIMNAILDRSALDYFRLIEVRSVPSFFRAPPGAPPEDAIVAIMVEFEGGDTVTLTEDAPIGTARIDYPFSKVILRQLADDGSYRYHKTVVRADGRQERDATPNSGTGAAFFVTTSVNTG